MTSRSIPNEAACPAPVEFLAKLLRCTEQEVAKQVQQLPGRQRAALAGFCYSRSHLRSLGIMIAAQCDVVALRLMTGAASEALIEQISRPEAFDQHERKATRGTISLARFAA